VRGTLAKVPWAICSRSRDVSISERTVPARIALDTEDQLAQPDALRGERLQIDPHRTEPEPAHLLTEVGSDAKHTIGRFHDTESEAVTLVVLHTDQHPVETIEIEFLRQCWGKHRRLDSPPLKRRSE